MNAHRNGEEPAHANFCISEAAKHTMKVTAAKRKAAVDDEEDSDNSDDDADDVIPIDGGVLRSPRVAAREKKARKVAKEQRKAAKAAERAQMEKDKDGLARAGRKVARAMRGA